MDPRASKRADRVFFHAMAIVSLAIVVAGFGRAYFFKGMFTTRLPTPLVDVHAGIMTAWIALQAIQPVLVAVRRVRWHRQLGLGGIVVACLVPPLALLTVIGQVRRHKWEPPVLAVDVAFSAVAAVDFAVLAWLGLRARVRDLSAHKRLMMLATVSMLGPALGRLPFVTSIPAYYGTLAGILVAALAYDLVALRRVHRATMLGVAVIAGSQLAAEVFSRFDVSTQLVVWMQRV